MTGENGGRMPSSYGSVPQIPVNVKTNQGLQKEG